MNLKYLILKSLSRCHGYLLPEKILVAEVMASSRATEAEAKLATYQALDAAAQVQGDADRAYVDSLNEAARVERSERAKSLKAASAKA